MKPLSVKTSTGLIRRIFLLVGTVVSAAFSALTPANAVLPGAVPLPDGMTVFPGLVAPGTNPGILLADLVVPGNYTTTSGTNSFTLQTAVYRDTSGTLDFYYQLSNSASSATALARLSLTNFGTSMTSVGFRVDGASLTGTSFANGTIAPVSADRSTDGTVVGFNFNVPASAEIMPGQTSNVLVISTDATSYTNGNFSVIDGGAATGPAYQPVSVPEPSSVALFGIPVLLLLCRNRARARRC